MMSMFSVKFRYSVSLLLGCSLTLLLLVMAGLALIWLPYDPHNIDIARRLQLPSSEHWFGTDHFGRDMFSMILQGSHNSLIVAFVAVGIGFGVGVPLGVWAAYKKGLVDNTTMYFSDFIFAFPALLSAVMMTALFGPGSVNAIVAIGIFNISVFARVTRASARIIWQKGYVLAAKATGLTPFHITWQHILPNIAGLLVVQATIQFALAILAEAGLSYLGLGAKPPEPSWGRMLLEAQNLIYQAPHTVLVPGLVIVLTVLGINLLGDTLRDAMDAKSTDHFI